MVLNAADAAFASEETKKDVAGEDFESLWSILMINREDMMELTRRMTPARSSVGRIAGAYFDEEGYVDGTFNTNF